MTTNQLDLTGFLGFTQVKLKKLDNDKVSTQLSEGFSHFFNPPTSIRHNTALLHN